MYIHMHVMVPMQIWFVHNYHSKQNINFLEHTNSFTFIAHVKLASDGMNFIPLFAHSLQTALRVFNRANSSRSARKKEESTRRRRKGKRKKKEKIHGNKWEKIKNKREREAVQKKLFRTYVARTNVSRFVIHLFRRFFVEDHEPGNERKRWHISENERRKEFRGKRSRTPTNSSCTRIPAHFEVICQSFFFNRVNESNRRVIIISHINKLLIIILAWISKTRDHWSTTATYFYNVISASSRDVTYLLNSQYQPLSLWQSAFDYISWSF